MHPRGRMRKCVVMLAIGMLPLTLRAQQATAEASSQRADGALRISIDSLYVDGGELRVDFHADSAVTMKLLDGLRRGLTAAMNYHVQLWQKRWFGDIVAERRLEWKASFDNWERKYIVVGLGERRMTAFAGTVREKWTRHRGLRVAEVSRLQPGKNYYLVIEAVLEPVSKENLREIRGWLGGEVKEISRLPSRADSSAAAADSTVRLAEAVADSTEDKPGFKLRILETLIDLIGFGGKKASVRSAVFQIEADGILWQP